MDLEKLQESYVQDWFEFDRFHRWFSAACQSTDNESVLTLAKRIEYLYVDCLLPELASVWDDAMNSRLALSKPWVGHNPQWRFFEDSVKGFVADKTRLIVIISDGLRYEVATELREVLAREHHEARIELGYMTSVVPSVTHYGIAALLPGKTMALVEGKGVTVDGQDSTGTEARGGILRRRVEESLCISYLQLKDAGRDGYRALLQGKKVVYIFHNTIDAAGEKPETAGTVPNQCVVAVEQIARLVRALYNYISAANIVITSDHGFIYQNKALEEYDRIPASQSDAVETGSRYTIGGSPVLEPGWHAVSMEYLLPGSGLYANIPKGVQRIRRPGAPKQYTHGGMMPQETILPLLCFSKSTSSAQLQRQPVDVDLSGVQGIIRNRIFKIAFLQREAVTESRIPRTLRMVFEDQAGRRITNEAQYVADSQEQNVERRRFSIQFTLKDAKYSEKETYDLVLRDVTEKDGTEIVTEYARLHYSISLLISSDF
jgi:uncharacterized protein (TIGR02687 family)